jgi:hypothetical protein
LASADLFEVPTPPASAADWTPDLATTAAWDSNTTNAARSSDVIGALQRRAEFEATRRISLGRNDALFRCAHLGTEAWPGLTGPIARRSVRNSPSARRSCPPLGTAAGGS